MDKVLEQLIQLNEMFKVNDKNGYWINGKNYILKKGNKPVILSAPHAVKQLREGVIKDEDYLTGPLTIYLADIMDCSYIVRVCNEGDDPNYPVGITLNNLQSEYIKILLKLAKEWENSLIIDMHGCKNKRLYDCNIWSDREQLCDKGIVTIFANNFNNFGLSAGLDNNFRGGQVTRQAGLVTNAFQLEIKRRIRSIKEDNWNLLNAFLLSMERSISETSELLLRFKK